MIANAHRYLPYCPPAIYWPEPIRDPWASSRKQRNFRLLNRSVPTEIEHIRPRAARPGEQLRPQSCQSGLLCQDMTLQIPIACSLI